MQLCGIAGRVEASSARAGKAAAPSEDRPREPERRGSPGTRGFPLHERSGGRSAGLWGPAPRCQPGPAPPFVAPPGLRDLSAASDGGESPRVKNGTALPGAGLPEPGCRDEGSPGRAGPCPCPGGLARSRDSPSCLAAAGTGREKPSPASGQVLVLTCSRRRTCGRDGNERCSAQPLPGSIFTFAGMTERAPGTEGGGLLHPVPSSGHGEEDSPSSALAGPSCGGEGWRATALPAHACGRRVAAFYARRRKCTTNELLLFS